MTDWQFGAHRFPAVPNQTCVPSGNEQLSVIFMLSRNTYVLSSFSVGVGCGSASVVRLSSVYHFTIVERTVPFDAPFPL